MHSKKVIHCKALQSATAIYRFTRLIIFLSVSQITAQVYFHNIFGSVNYGVGVFVWSCEKKNSFGTDWSKYDCLQSESVKKQSPKVTEICWVAKAKVQQKEYIVRVLNEPETELLSLPFRYDSTVHLFSEFSTPLNGCFSRNNLGI